MRGKLWQIGNSSMLQSMMVLFSIKSKRQPQYNKGGFRQFPPAKLLPKRKSCRRFVTEQDVLANIVVSLALCIGIAFSTVVAWILVSCILADGIMGSPLWDIIHVLHSLVGSSGGGGIERTYLLGWHRLIPIHVLHLTAIHRWLRSIRSSRTGLDLRGV